MSGSAHVVSFDALRAFRAALATFGEDAGQALAEVRMELERFEQWIVHEQLPYWKNQIRIRDDAVIEAKLNLTRCLAATLDVNHTPACYDEKKQLANAKRRLEVAEDRLKKVRFWANEIQKITFDYRSQAEPLTRDLEAGVPSAMAQLDRLILRLEAYQAVAPPAASSSAGISTTASAIASKGQSVASGDKSQGAEPARAETELAEATSDDPEQTLDDSGEASP